MKDSVALTRRQVHHLSAEMLAMAFGGFTVADHTRGAARPLTCRIVGSTQRDNAQGWIDSPGLALQHMGGYRTGRVEDLPEQEDRGSTYLITGAAPVYEASWRLSLKTANVFDQTDVTGQIEDYLRGIENTSRVKTELIGTSVFLSDELIPGFRLRLNPGRFSHNARTDHVMSYVVLTVNYPLKQVQVNLPKLMRVGYFTNHAYTPLQEPVPPITGGTP